MLATIPSIYKLRKYLNLFGQEFEWSNASYGGGFSQIYADDDNEEVDILTTESFKFEVIRNMAPQLLSSELSKKETDCGDLFHFKMRYMGELDRGGLYLNSELNDMFDDIKYEVSAAFGGDRRIKTEDLSLLISLVDGLQTPDAKVAKEVYEDILLNLKVSKDLDSIMEFDYLYLDLDARQVLFDEDNDRYRLFDLYFV